MLRNKLATLTPYPATIDLASSTTLAVKKAETLKSPLLFISF
jgi:hypothetical protein